jgi:hypothetical protein
MNRTKRDYPPSGSQRLQRVTTALAGLFFLSLAGYLLVGVTVAFRGVGETLSGALLMLYAGTSVVLPVSVLAAVARRLLGHPRDSPGPDDRVERRQLVSSALDVVEAVLSVIVLLVAAGVGYLYLTQPGSAEAGAIFIGAGLAVTLAGGALAAIVLARRPFDSTPLGA